MAPEILGRGPGLRLLLLHSLLLTLLLLSAGAGIAWGQLEFEGPTFYPAGNEPGVIAVGDFNGDSIPDLAVALYRQADIAVLLGVGEGSFASPIFLPVSSADDVVCSDLNADGILDLVIAIGLHDGWVGVALGNGDGTFLPPVMYPTGVASVAVAVADVNGDSIPDLALANYGTGASSGISILLGSGDGTFGPRTFYTTGSNSFPCDVAIGDFNNDGVPDLCAALNNARRVAILLGLGDGTFGPPQSFFVDETPLALGLGDFNGDGNLDVAVTDWGHPNHPTLGVFMGQGDGTLGPVTLYAVGGGPHSVAVCDLFSDGVLDLVITEEWTDRVSVMLGRGDGTFEPPRSYWAGNGPFSVAVSDLDGDGLLDLALAARYSDSVAILEGVLDPASEEAGPRVTASIPALAVDPNPMVAQTTIRFELGEPSRATLRLLDSGGRTVQHLFEGDFPAGSNRLTWELARARPERIPAGVYFLVLEAGDQQRVRRVTIIR